MQITSQPEPPVARVRLQPRGSWLAVILIFLFVLTEAAFVCLLPLVVLYFVESAQRPRNQAALISLLAGVAIALAIALAAGFFRDFLFVRLRGRSLAEIRKSMFHRLQSLSMRFHEALDRNQMLERFSTDLGNVEYAFTLAISWGLLPLLTAMLATGLMLGLDWHIGLVGVILWPWALLAPRAMSPKSARALHDTHKHETSVLSVVAESLSAQAVIRAFAVEHLGAAAFRARNEALTRSAMKAGLWSAFVDRFTGAGILLEQIFVLGLSLWLVSGRQMTIGTMVGLQMLAALLGSSLLYLVEYLPVLVSAQEAFQGVRESLQDTSAVVDAPDARILPPFSSEIVFSDVSFDVGFHDVHDAGVRGRYK